MKVQSMKFENNGLNRSTDKTILKCIFVAETEKC